MQNARPVDFLSGPAVVSGAKQALAVTLVAKVACPIQSWRSSGSDDMLLSSNI